MLKWWVFGALVEWECYNANSGIDLNNDQATVVTKVCGREMALPRNSSVVPLFHSFLSTSRVSTFSLSRPYTRFIVSISLYHSFLLALFCCCKLSYHCCSSPLSILQTFKNKHSTTLDIFLQQSRNFDSRPSFIFDVKSFLPCVWNRHFVTASWFESWMTITAFQRSHIPFFYKFKNNESHSACLHINMLQRTRKQQQMDLLQRTPSMPSSMTICQRAKTNGGKMRRIEVRRPERRQLHCGSLNGLSHHSRIYWTNRSAKEVHVALQGGDIQYRSRLGRSPRGGRRNRTQELVSRLSRLWLGIRHCRQFLFNHPSRKLSRDDLWIWLHSGLWMETYQRRGTIAHSSRTYREMPFTRMKVRRARFTKDRGNRHWKMRRQTCHKID